MKKLYDNRHFIKLQAEKRDNYNKTLLNNINTKNEIRNTIQENKF